MNLLKKGILALLIVGLVVSCEEDDSISAPNEGNSGTGLTEITFPPIPTSSVKASGDGTIITIRPQGLGVTSYIVDFGDPNSTSDIVTITEDAGTASYDYPNDVEEATYTITVTATSDQGFAEVVQTKNVTVTHEFESIDTSPSSPTARRYNVFSIFSDGFEYDGAFVGYPIADAATGGKVVALDSGNSILEFSRLGNTTGVLELKDEVVIADAFASGVAATDIHFDVHSNFETGIDKLKITLVNGGTEYVYNQDLSDGEWISIDLDLATDFSAPVVQFDEIIFELGAGGTASDHATINVDNVYMSKMTGSTIINGDFEDGQDFWKWGVFTDGETNPFGSSSDGSDFDIDGNDTGGKTRGAKWSSSQSGGELRSSSSRYAYQELLLTPNTNYILEYQYAIKDDSGDDPFGGRKVVGLILDGQYIDGADAVDDIVSDNLGFHEGKIAEGKFSDTTNDFGTLVSIPFTSNDSGEIAVMFYAVTPKDAYIDNVKVFEAP